MKKIYKKLRYKEYFGRLSKKNKGQLNKLFNSRYKIDSAKKWLFHYIDSLPNKEKMPKISGVIIYDSVETKKSLFLSKKVFKKNYRKYINSKHRHVMSYDEFQDNIRKEKNKIVVSVFHDLNLASSWSDALLMIKDGEIKAFGDSQEVLTQETIKNVFNVAS